MKNLDHTFAALSDPTRRAILARLAQSDATAGELAAPFSISQPAISRHLKVLEKAALIQRQRDGQHQRFHLMPGALKTAHDWFAFYARFWGESFDKLADHLKKDRKPHG